MQNFIEISIDCSPDLIDMIGAELLASGYESIIEQEPGILTYILETEWNEQELLELLSKYGIGPAAVHSKTVPNQNWNEIWESSYEPICIDNRIRIRAPFHVEDSSYENELVIKPKNTFGTGHHETTQLMLQLMLDETFSGKLIFDFGCGTGILGLMALKLGAIQVIGNDIDAWSTDNINENMQLNHLEAFEFRQGDLSVIKIDECFDGILANINKNILMANFEKLSIHLNAGGFLLISGFYEEDIIDLKIAAAKFGLSMVNSKGQNGWAAAKLNRDK
jgi:ribosomal protein L11 methyltransferase